MLEAVIAGTLFVILNSYFSYKWGFKSGLTEGVDGCLCTLESEGIIELEITEDGEENIIPKK
jgi:hypothetical protein